MDGGQGTEEAGGIRSRRSAEGRAIRGTPSGRSCVKRDRSGERGRNTDRSSTATELAEAFYLRVDQPPPVPMSDEPFPGI